jgi:5-methylcytosine-specific restriction protein B
MTNYLVDGKVEDQSWMNLWENHLYGLLFEYLRGLPNAEEDMKKLYRAYNMDDKYICENGIVKKVAYE